MGALTYEQFLELAKVVVAGLATIAIPIVIACINKRTKDKDKPAAAVPEVIQGMTVDTNQIMWLQLAKSLRERVEELEEQLEVAQARIKDLLARLKQQGPDAE